MIMNKIYEKYGMSYFIPECIPTDDPEVAFKDCDAAFLVGAMPRKAGMERGDLLAANVKIFKVQGQALDKVAKKSCKVCVPVIMIGGKLAVS